MVRDSIERETTIEAPVERVWDFLTQPEHLGTWFSDAGAEVDLRPGGEIVMTWAEHGVAHAIVERVEPPREFAFRWPIVGTHVADGTSTLVEFTLMPEGESTRVLVRESGFAALDLPGEEQVRHHERNTEGWRIELGHLVEHVQRVAA